MKTWMAVFLSSITLLGNAQVSKYPAVCTSGDRQIWQTKRTMVQNLDTLPVAQRLVAVGQSFGGTPYQSHTLEVTSDEQLVVNLRGLDCTTFVESALALVLQSDPTFEGYCQALQRLRYRNDTLDGYPSRLHYLSDWLYENQRKGTLQIITDQLGGQPFDKSLRFMTTHRAAYRQLEEPRNYEALRQVEASLTQRHLSYLPKDRVQRVESQLRDGDLLAITTSLGGLDASHVGFAVRRNGRVHLLHASSEAGKVIVSRQPLAEYLLAHPTQTGLMVARLAVR
ncbi:MAG: DUF1460 domain-containing protein [Ferruginibacter sp.]|nr:DUF1460 domain-containing protein [Cytophagales bacterium]